MNHFSSFSFSLTNKEKYLLNNENDKLQFMNLDNFGNYFSRKDFACFSNSFQFNKINLIN